MKRNDAVFLQHILDAIQRIREYLTDVSEEEFRERGLVQDAVLRQLEIIGEASRNLSDDARLLHPQVPWDQIIGLRNKLIHASFSVDLSIVGEIVREDIPVLEEEVEDILGSAEGSRTMPRGER